MATIQIYTGAGDGYVGHSNNPSNAVWATLRDGTAYTLTANATGSSAGMRARVGNFNAGNANTLEHGFLPADTSSIGSSATISSATLKIWTQSVVNSDTSTGSFVAVIATTQASTSTLATTDFHNVTLTDLGNLSVASITTGAYNTWTIASPDTNINKTGVTKLGLAVGFDINNVQPSLPFNDNIVGFYGYASEQTGTANDPYYEIIYTLPSVKTRNSVAIANIKTVNTIT